MRLSRIVIKNLRSLKMVDVPLSAASTVILGENNTGKSTIIHALRLVLDVSLPSSYRSLLKEDVNCEVDQQEPFQVLCGIEFSDFEGKENELALLHGTQLEPNRARIFYRFRPKRIVREGLENKTISPDTLTLEDYQWELSGGGNPQIDLTEIEWDHENAELGASSFQLQNLQSYLVEFLPALRDVEADLRQSSRSSLARLIEASGIDKDERETLISIVSEANEKIEASPTIQSIAEAIDSSLKNVTGSAFNLDVYLGLSSPTFQSIIRNLIVLLSNSYMEEFEPRRNGLGLNNILFIAILMERLRKRAAQGKSSGELILIEEPEAHLHPQLQATLYDALKLLPYQSIVTTHSTHITSRAPLGAFITLTAVDGQSPIAKAPASIPGLSPAIVQDLERYLDATKSNLLFARRVMLVEGAAEMLLIPPLVKKVLDIDLEREGISVVGIHGCHFDVFASLFNNDGLPKRCAIVADADLDPSDIEPDAGDDVPVKPNLEAIESEHVRAFLGATTFEREISEIGNITLLRKTVGALGAAKLHGVLNGIEADLIFDDDLVMSDEVKNRILRTAKRFGKGRFAQVATRYVSDAEYIPPYIQQAIEWLLEDQAL